MPTVTTRGIVLKRRNYSEADRILTIFTQRYGKISAIAKGVRKARSKMAGNLEPFIENMLRLAEGKTWFVVAEATPLIAFTKIRENLKLTSIGYVIAEITDTLTREEEHQPSVYELLWQTLNLLEKKDPTHLLPAFIWKILSEIGFRPELYHCVESHEKLGPEGILFSSNLGGILDGSHKSADPEAMPVSPTTVKLMRVILTDIAFIDKVTITPKVAKEFQSIVTRYSEQVLGSQPKSLIFLKEVYRQI